MALGDDLPHATTPIPVERLNGRAGFSRVQSAVVSWESPLDPASLPGLDAIGAPGAALLWDLTDGVPLPCFAELDAWPEQDARGPALILRPVMPAPRGHQIAAVLTAGVRTADGAPITAPAWFEALRSGEEVEGVADADGWRAMLDTLAAQGAPEPVLAFSWTAGDGRERLSALLADLPLPTSFSLSAAPVDELPFTARQATGTFATRSWLVDDGAFDADLTAHGTTDAPLFVHVSAAAAAAPPGTAPVWLFGHGIFSTPDLYLADPTDPSDVLELAERAGAVVIATHWRGLATPDLATPLNVGADFGQFPQLTDKLTQAVANTAALARLIAEGDLLSDPVFDGRADPTSLKYYGISLGAIEGAVLFASTETLPQGVLHVGGSTWSTMLERSTNWVSFEGFVTASIPSAYDRQLLYSVSQLFWDPVDPASWSDELHDRSLLWQLAVGDDQVSNLTTWTLMRGVGATLLHPSGEAPWGVPTSADGGPTPPMKPAIATFDPELGSYDGDNRPAPKSLAHDTPRQWEGAKLQTLRFLDLDDPGVVQHFCGAAACDASNTGAP